jgi:prophage regulatory protein
MATSLLRLPAVLQRTATKKTNLYGLIKAGRFPRPIKLTERTVAWISTEVDEWIQQRIATARGGGAQ